MTAKRSREPGGAPAPRICLLTESFHPIVGGGESHARSLGESLIEREVPVFVLTQRRPRGIRRREEIGRIPVIRVRSGGSDRWGKYLMLPSVVWNLLMLRDRYDLIYVCGMRTLGVPASLVGQLLGRPVVLRSESQTELSGEYALGRTPQLLKPIIAWLLRRRNSLYGRAAAFLSISSDIMTEYRSCGVPESQIALIHNGVDTEEFRPGSPAERDRMREQLDLSHDRPVVVYTGKLNRGKGLEMLLRAWRLLCDDLDGHLVLVGSGANQFLSCETELRSFVERHQMESRVTFTGYVSNVPDYLRAADLFTLPSESESFGLALVEAMACGLPSVVTDAGGMPEIVTDGREGLIVSVGDEERLVDALRRLLGDREAREQMGRAARSTAVERFSIQAVAAAHERLFRRVLGEEAST